MLTEEIQCEVYGNLSSSQFFCKSKTILKNKDYILFIFYLLIKYLFLHNHRFTYTCKKQYREIPRTLYSVSLMITFYKIIVQYQN